MAEEKETDSNDSKGSNESKPGTDNKNAIDRKKSKDSKSESTKKEKEHPHRLLEWLHEQVYDQHNIDRRPTCMWSLS